MVVTVTNAGPDADTLHVLPTAWFRNTWSWDFGAPKPVMEATGATSARVEHPYLGSLELLADSGPDGTEPELLFCENETNMARLYGAAAGDPVSQGRDQRPCDPRRGDRQPGAARHQVCLLVQAGGRGRAARSSCGSGCARAAPAKAAAAFGSGLRTASSPPGGGRPMSSTPS